MTSSAPDVLVQPAYFTAPDYASTLGPEYGDLAAAAGFPPDPEQALVLDPMLGMDRNGKMTSFEACVIGPRQNIKTGLAKIKVLGDGWLLNTPLIVWTAHEFSTTSEALRDFRVLIESNDFLAKRVLKIHMAAGAEAIELRSGTRIRFRARTKAGGRGIAGDRLVLDEAFALQPDHMGALLPVLSTRPEAQILYGSSAGLAASSVLRSIRDRGRVGTGRLVYAEWCDERPCESGSRCLHHLDDPTCRLNDREAWGNANSQAGRRISWQYLQDEREALPPEEFARERLGWWDEPDLTVSPLPNWPNLLTDAEPPTPLMFGLGVSIDRAWASFGASGVVDGVVTLGGVKRGEGTAWVVDEAKRLTSTYGVPLCMDVKGPGSDLVPLLKEAGVPLVEGTYADYLDACGSLFDAVRDSTVRHMGGDDLNNAVEACTKQVVGDRFRWGRKHGDVSMLEAVTWARWGAMNTTAEPSVFVI